MNKLLIIALLLGISAANGSDLAPSNFSCGPCQRVVIRYRYNVNYEGAHYGSVGWFPNLGQCQEARDLDTRCKREEDDGFDQDWDED
jgi:hypothetical protein